MWDCTGHYSQLPQCDRNIIVLASLIHNNLVITCTYVHTSHETSMYALLLLKYIAVQFRL